MTCLSSAAVKTPSRSSSSAVSVECPLLYADWNWLKLAELSRWGRRRANTSLSRTLDTVDRLEIGLYLQNGWRSACNFKMNCNDMLPILIMLQILHNSVCIVCIHCSSSTVLKGASQQENLVYQIIQDAGNKGMRPVFYGNGDVVKNPVNLC